MSAVSKLELAGIALVLLTVSHTGVYLYGRYAEKQSRLVAVLAGTITVQNKQTDGLRKADMPYENIIIPTIQKIPSVGKTCPVPPAVVSTFRLLPDADRD